MIYQILEGLKAKVVDQVGWKQDRLQAIDTISRLVDRIDHNVEVFPIDNYDRLVRTLNSLKDESLTLAELELAREIVNYKFGDMQCHTSSVIMRIKG